MRLLIAPLHYSFGKDSGSEHTRAYEYLESLAQDKNALLAGKIRPMSADKAALYLLKGIANGSFVMLPGFMCKLTYFLNRHVPFLLGGIINRELRSYWKRM